MPNSVISSITLPSGTTYDLKDAAARSAIENLQSLATGAMYYVGISSTAITDGGTQKPTIDSVEKTMGADDAGAVAIYGEKEYVWNGSKWQEFGSTGSLKALAFKDNASGTYTPAGSVSATFSGSSLTSTGNFTPSGSIAVNAASGSGTSYTPEGSVAAPTIGVASAGSTASITPFGTAGTLPSLSMTVSNGNLAISFSQGTLPTAGTAVTVKTGDASYFATAPEFTGTEKKLAFTGTQGSVSVSGTPEGSISGSFSGTEATVTVS